MEILKLIKANIRHKKGAFKSIVALMAIIVLSFAGTISNNDNIDRTLKEAHKWAGTADMTAFVPVLNMNEEISDSIRSNSNVTDMKMTDCIYANDITFNGQDAYQMVFLFPESRKFYRVFNNSFTGYIDNPEPLKEGEIYIPYGLKGVNDGLEIGSEVCFKSTTDKISENENSDKHTFKVKGFIAEPHFGAAIISTKRFFISDADFNKIYSVVGEHNKLIQFEIFLKNDADYIKVKKELDDSCGLAEAANLIISDKETTDYTTLYSDAGSGVVAAFVILLVVIAIITMYHSISASIEMEYINLGVLKSQGFTTGKLRIVYILQYIIAEVIGAVIGLILSFPLLYFLGTLFQSITGLATIHRISIVKCILLAIGIIAISVIFIVIATAKVSRISPVRAISGGKSEIHFDSILNIPVKAKPLSFFMGLRQFTSRFKSYTGVMLIVALLVYFMMSIMLLSDRLSGGKIITGMIYPDLGFAPSETFQISDMEKVTNTVHNIDKDAKVTFNYTSYIMADGIEFGCDAVTPVEHLYQPLDGRMPRYSNEVAITEIVSEELGKEIGDTITLGSRSNKKEFIITGYYQSLMELGRTFTITAEGLYELTGKNSNCHIDLSDRAYLDEVSKALDDNFSNIIAAKVIHDESDSYDEGMIKLIDSICQILVIVVFAISIVFSAVVISMVCSRSFIKERNDIGILKSLGFTADSLRIQFSFRFMLIAAIGSIIGGIVSYFFTSPLLESLMKIVGLTQIETVITPLTFVISTAAICVSFFLFAFISARKINTVEIRELISE